MTDLPPADKPRPPDRDPAPMPGGPATAPDTSAHGRPPAGRRLLRWIGGRGVATTALVLATGILGVSLVLVETLRERAVAEGDRARRAGQEQQAELARASADSARYAAQRGQWREALASYHKALDLGHEDEIGLRVGVLDCRLALYQYPQLRAELAELTGRPDLGPREGLVLLRQAQAALLAPWAGDPEDLARRALARGLPGPDAAYARAYLARTIPEAVTHLQAATRLDPWHAPAHSFLPLLLFVTGRVPEAREAFAQARLIVPDSINVLLTAVLLASMEGDQAALEAALARVERQADRDLAAVFRWIGSYVAEFQREEVQWNGMSHARIAMLAMGWARVGPRLARLLNDADPSEAHPGAGFPMFNLPFLRGISDLAEVKALRQGKALAAFAGPRDQATIIKNLSELARILPEGAALANKGAALEQAGHLREAEETLRRALEAPSWSGVRRPVQFRLARVQWRLSQGANQTERERRAWRDRALANVRELAQSGPLPPGPAFYLIALATDAGEHELALTLAQALVRQDPKNQAAWLARLDAELALSAYDRAVATAAQILKQKPGEFAGLKARLLGQPMRGGPDGALAAALEMSRDDPLGPLPGQVRDLLASRSQFLQAWLPVLDVKLRFLPALRLARAGQAESARAEAEKLRSGKDEGPALYACACVEALAQAAVQRDDKRPAAEREREATRHAARAVHWLEQARAHGFFDEAPRRQGVLGDPDLRTLQARPEFQNFCKGLPAAGRPAP
jgi:tetratricopeptide (TPR) repeat protein